LGPAGQTDQTSPTGDNLEAWPRESDNQLTGSRLFSYIRSVCWSPIMTIVFYMVVPVGISEMRSEFRVRRQLGRSVKSNSAMANPAISPWSLGVQIQQRCSEATLDCLRERKVSSQVGMPTQEMRLLLLVVLFLLPIAVSGGRTSGARQRSGPLVGSQQH
jgi:hypothetical protein